MEDDKRDIKVWLPFALSLMLAVGMIFGYQMNEKDDGPLISKIESDTNSGPIGTVEELIRFIESKYVDTIDRKPLVSSAIEAVLTQLDPHSVYISPDQLQQINQEMEGSFDGIGIESFYIDDTVFIINTIAESPAERAGISSFDRLLKVGEEDVAGQGYSFTEIEDRIKGAAGEQISLTFLTQEGRTKEVVVTIGDVLISSIDAAINITPDVGYIKIKRFSSRTYREFMDEFERMYEAGTKHLILDLRGNPGGYLPQATNILSQLFREKGKLLVYTEGRKDQRLEYKTTGKPFFDVDRLAVLIDERSASGSEIIAGAIQEWDRGVVIGRRSFGKGLVQEQYSLQNGGALRITVARYYTPSGRSIQRTYSDLKEYDDDLYDRIHSGELFAEDSTSTSTDTTVYQTRLLNRPVQGGGGITPDVFIPLDSLDLDYEYATLAGNVSRFVFDYVSHRSADIEVSIELLDQLTKRYLDVEAKEQTVWSKNLTAKLQKEIESSLRRYVEGEASAQKSIAKDDKAIQTAMDYVTGTAELTAY